MSTPNFLQEKLGIQYPIILAPMFLVSNEEMIIEALRAGITGAIPALNYRSIEDFQAAIRSIRKKQKGPFGINLIVNRSNIHLEKQLEVCCSEKVDFIITSLGSPKEVIREVHKYGGLVFCDVTSYEYAQKVEQLGADAVIAVGSEAGGHAGPVKSVELIRELKEHCNLPIISAGGISNHASYQERMDLDIAGVSVGTIFIASKESPVSEKYKQACVNYGANDIVTTTKLSGVPCTVINTPYVQKMGVKQSFFLRFLNKRKSLKKWLKSLTFLLGMKKLRNAAFGYDYKEVWCAGPSIEHVKEIKSITAIVQDITGSTS
ncbi:MAG: nitronate monooxygenase [Bacteroidetes bacterium]|nr:MAG: nitronate monooxygenase [Bacteroidota bacterium]